MLFLRYRFLDFFIPIRLHKILTAYAETYACFTSLVRNFGRKVWKLWGDVSHVMATAA